jgi:glyoxylase-like metal-dependent hydrolase (beta-lactamase superfamily II)
VCYYCEEEGVLLSGDTLFYRSIGRTDLFGGDYATLVESIKQRLFCLPPQTKVYPGHGPATTIGDEQMMF